MVRSGWLGSGSRAGLPFARSTSSSPSNVIESVFLRLVVVVVVGFEQVRPGGVFRRLCVGASTVIKRSEAYHLVVPGGGG